MADQKVQTYGDLPHVNDLTFEMLQNLILLLNAEERKFGEVLVVFKDDTVSVKSLREKVDEITSIEGIYTREGCVCCIDNPSDGVHIYICFACHLFLETGNRLSTFGQKGCCEYCYSDQEPYKHVGVNLGMFSCVDCDMKTVSSILNLDPNHRLELEGRLAKVNEDELESRLIEIYPYNGSSVKSAHKTC
jgi:hypothetical protein